MLTSDRVLVHGIDACACCRGCVRVTWPGTRPLAGLTLSAWPTASHITQTMIIGVEHFAITDVRDWTVVVVMDASTFLDAVQRTTQVASHVHGEGMACGLTRACLAWCPAGYRACCRRDGPCGQRHRQYPGHTRHVAPARARLAPRLRGIHTEPAHVGPSGAGLEAHIHPRAARPGTR